MGEPPDLQEPSFENEQNLSERTIVRQNRWPDGVVPYEIQENFYYYSQLLYAIGHIQNNTCIR